MMNLYLITGVVLITITVFRNNKIPLIPVSYTLGLINFLFSLTGIISNFMSPSSRSSALLGDRVFDTELLISLIGFTLFISLLQVSKNKVIQGFILFLNTAAIIYLLILRTRAGWVAAVIMLFAIIIMVWRYYRQSLNVSKIILKAGIFIITAFSLYILIPVKQNSERPDALKTVESIFDMKYFSNQSRLDFWEASLKMIINHPISGIGAGKWPGNYPQYNGRVYNDENVDMNFAINPHNDYLEILAEFGIPGFLVFSLFIITGLYSLFKKSGSGINYLPYFISAVGICILMFFSFTKDNFLVMIIISVCMGAGYSGNYKIRIMKNEFLEKHKRFFRISFIILGMLLLSAGIIFKVMNYLNEKVYLDAMQLKAQGNYNQMLIKLDAVSKYFYPVDMNKMPVDYYRGVGYFELGQYDKALEKFKGARNYMEYYPTIMNNEASALYMTGNFMTAEERYLEVKKMFPNFIEPQINLLSFYTNLNRTEEAKNLIAELDSKSFYPKYVKNYSVYLQIKDYFKVNLK